MHKPTALLLLVAVIAVIAGAIMVPQLLSGTSAPVGRWTPAEEVEGTVDPVPQTSDAEAAGLERAEANLQAPLVIDPEERVAALLGGRVIDKFRQPVPGARVWLEFGRSQQRGGDRGNRARRVPDPVVTDAAGRFAFQGQTFRNLRVSVQVQHRGHAPGLFDKDFGQVGVGLGAANAEIDLGDLMLESGALVRGRVTDLDGNGVPGAEVTLQPVGRNALQWQRNREELLPQQLTDASGFYACANVAAGDYAISAIAKRHTEGRSENFAATEEQAVEVADIRLGPGYEVTGYVRSSLGEPIANANVVMRSSPGTNGNGSGENTRQGGGRQRGRATPFGGRGRDHRTRTDETGRFFLEHLPGSLLELQVDAEGFLDHREDGIDARLGQLISVAMLDGLRITGVAKEVSGEPVTSYAVRTIRLRGLPDPTSPALDLDEIMLRLQSGDLDEATRNQLRAQMQRLAGDVGNGGRRGGGRGGNRDVADGAGQSGGSQDFGQPQRHLDGAFVESGLQEGVYEVQIESPGLARFRSAELEVRRAAPAPHVTAVLDPGAYVAGVVVDDRGEPVAGATVELRSEGEASGNRAGGNPTRTGQPDWTGMARDWARAASGVAVRLEVRSDQEGLFFVKNAPRGSYRLSASANGFTSATSEPFDLQADRQGFELRLGLLGSLIGTVAGVVPGDVGEARVGAIMIPESGGLGLGNMFGGRGGRGFHTVEVEGDGSYRIDGLAPGNYVVRSWLGSPQQLMRELSPAFMAGNLQPDVIVRGGDATRFDLALTRPQVGIVTGSVTHNGTSASGFQVELNRRPDDTASPASLETGGLAGRAPRFMNFGQTFRDTVSPSGSFTIKDVPAGLYDLKITGSRRSGTLFEEPIQVFADGTTERTYSLTSGSLTGTLTVGDGSDPKQLDGRVSLLPGLVEMPDDLSAWLRQNTSFDARIQDASFSIEPVPMGSYLLVVQARNREPTAQAIVIDGAQSVVVMAGKTTATSKNGTGQGGGPR